MALDFKKMSTTQLMVMGLGTVVAFMILAALVISIAKRPSGPPKQRSTLVDAGPTAADIAVEQLRGELKQLEERIGVSEKATQAAFSQTAAAIDQQNANIQIMDKNQSTTNARVSTLERARLGMRAVAVRPEDQPNRPTRQQRMSAGVGSGASQQGQQIKLASTPAYQVQATVGDRAWVRAGSEEYSVRPGERLPVTGPLVVTGVEPSGRVSVGVESDVK